MPAQYSTGDAPASCGQPGVDMAIRGRDLCPPDLLNARSLAVFGRKRGSCPPPKQNANESAFFVKGCVPFFSVQSTLPYRTPSVRHGACYEERPERGSPRLKCGMSRLIRACPASYAARPSSYAARPYSCSARPSSNVARPSSYAARPTSYEARPAPFDLSLGSAFHVPPARPL